MAAGENVKVVANLMNITYNTYQFRNDPIVTVAVEECLQSVDDESAQNIIYPSSFECSSQVWKEGSRMDRRGGNFVVLWALIERRGLYCM